VPHFYPITPYLENFPYYKLRLFTHCLITCFNWLSLSKMIHLWKYIWRILTLRRAKETCLLLFQSQARTIPKPDDYNQTEVINPNTINQLVFLLPFFMNYKLIYILKTQTIKISPTKIKYQFHQFLHKDSKSSFLNPNLMHTQNIYSTDTSDRRCIRQCLTPTPTCVVIT
jgi:hypothetical protein